MNLLVLVCKFDSKSYGLVTGTDFVFFVKNEETVPTGNKVNYIITIFVIASLILRIQHYYVMLIVKLVTKIVIP